MRKCGDCKECCTTLDHSVTPYDTPCPHECRKGCGIYADRPDDCQSFRCSWLDGHLPRKDRPDLSGLIVGMELTRLGPTVVLYETRDGAANRGRGVGLCNMAGEHATRQGIPCFLRRHPVGFAALNQKALYGAVDLIREEIGDEDD